MTWCKDTARDAAVRAAEDNRTGPLPTLQEAIVLAFGFDKASAQRACDEVNSWPEDVRKDCRVVLGDSLEQGVERIQALVEAWRWGKRLMAARYPAMIPKSVSGSNTVEHENKGESMREKGTTRDEQAAAYRAEAIARPFAEAAERSPTVSETGDGQSGMRTERVVLEITREAWRKASSTSSDNWSKAAKEAGIIFLPGESVRVVEEAVGSVDDRAYADRIGCDEERDFANRILDQRDAAIRERDKLKARVAELESCSWVPKTERDAIQARVAELEARTSTAGEDSCVAPAASGGLQQNVRDGKSGAQACDSGQIGRLEAASGGGEHFADANKMVEQPRGWLTAEERKLIGKLRKNAAAIHLLHIERDTNGFAEAVQQSVKTVDNLLARSSPPEVVLPNVYDHIGLRPVYLWADVIAALAAAGVAVKEVGRE
jgi:hypothetical protein